MEARKAGIGNFCVFPFNKLVPPAMRALLDGEREGSGRIDMFLLPGHVAVVIGLAPFLFLAEEYGRAAAVGGFEPADILSALCLMTGMLAEGRPGVGNTYVRAVSPGGSQRAAAESFSLRLIHHTNCTLDSSMMVIARKTICAFISLVLF